MDRPNEDSAIADDGVLTSNYTDSKQSSTSSKNSLGLESEQSSPLSQNMLTLTATESEQTSPSSQNSSGITAVESEHTLSSPQNLPGLKATEIEQNSSSAQQLSGLIATESKHNVNSKKYQETQNSEDSETAGLGSNLNLKKNSIRSESVGLTATESAQSLSPSQKSLGSTAIESEQNVNSKNEDTNPKIQRLEDSATAGGGSSLDSKQNSIRLESVGLTATETAQSSSSSQNPLGLTATESEQNVNSKNQDINPKTQDSEESTTAGRGRTLNSKQNSITSESVGLRAPESAENLSSSQNSLGLATNESDQMVNSKNKDTNPKTQHSEDLTYAGRGCSLNSKQNSITSGSVELRATESAESLSSSQNSLGLTTNESDQMISSKNKDTNSKTQHSEDLKYAGRGCSLNSKQNSIKSESVEREYDMYSLQNIQINSKTENSQDSTIGLKCDVNPSQNPITSEPAGKRYNIYSLQNILINPKRQNAEDSITVGRKCVTTNSSQSSESVGAENNINSKNLTCIETGKDGKNTEENKWTNLKEQHSQIPTFLGRERIKFSLEYSRNSKYVARNAYLRNSKFLRKIGRMYTTQNSRHLKMLPRECDWYSLQNHRLNVEDMSETKHSQISIPAGFNIYSLQALTNSNSNFREIERGTCSRNPHNLKFVEIDKTYSQTSTNPKYAETYPEDARNSKPAESEHGGYSEDLRISKSEGRYSTPDLRDLKSPEHDISRNLKCADRELESVSSQDSINSKSARRDYRTHSSPRKHNVSQTTRRSKSFDRENRIYSTTNSRNSKSQERAHRMDSLEESINSKVADRKYRTHSPGNSSEYSAHLRRNSREYRKHSPGNSKHSRSNRREHKSSGKHRRHSSHDSTNSKLAGREYRTHLLRNARSTEREDESHSSQTTRVSKFVEREHIKYSSHSSRSSKYAKREYRTDSSKDLTNSKYAEREYGKDSSKGSNNTKYADRKYRQDSSRDSKYEEREYRRDSSKCSKYEEREYRRDFSKDSRHSKYTEWIRIDSSQDSGNSKYTESEWMKKDSSQDSRNSKYTEREYKKGFSNGSKYAEREYRRNSSQDSRDRPQNSKFSEREDRAHLLRTSRNARCVRSENDPYSTTKPTARELSTQSSQETEDTNRKSLELSSRLESKIVKVTNNEQNTYSETGFNTANRIVTETTSNTKAPSSYKKSLNGNKLIGKHNTRRSNYEMNNKHKIENKSKERICFKTDARNKKYLKQISLSQIFLEKQREIELQKMLKEEDDADDPNASDDSGCDLNQNDENGSHFDLNKTYQNKTNTSEKHNLNDENNSTNNCILSEQTNKSATDLNKIDAKDTINNGNQTVKINKSATDSNHTNGINGSTTDLNQIDRINKSTNDLNCFNRINTSMADLNQSERVNKCATYLNQTDKINESASGLNDPDKINKSATNLNQIDLFGKINKYATYLKQVDLSNKINKCRTELNSTGINKKPDHIATKQSAKRKYFYEINEYKRNSEWNQSDGHVINTRVSGLNQNDKCNSLHKTVESNLNQNKKIKKNYTNCVLNGGFENSTNNCHKNPECNETRGENNSCDFNKNLKTCDLNQINSDLNPAEKSKTANLELNEDAKIDNSDNQNLIKNIDVESKHLETSKIGNKNVNENRWPNLIEIDTSETVNAKRNREGGISSVLIDNENLGSGLHQIDTSKISTTKTIAEGGFSKIQRETSVNERSTELSEKLEEIRSEKYLNNMLNSICLKPEDLLNDRFFYKFPEESISGQPQNSCEFKLNSSCVEESLVQENYSNAEEDLLKTKGLYLVQEDDNSNSLNNNKGSFVDWSEENVLKNTEQFSFGVSAATSSRNIWDNIEKSSLAVTEVKTRNNILANIKHNSLEVSEEKTGHIKESFGVSEGETSKNHLIINRSSLVDSNKKTRRIILENIKEYSLGVREPLIRSCNKDYSECDENVTQSTMVIHKMKTRGKEQRSRKSILTEQEESKTSKQTGLFDGEKIIRKIVLDQDRRERNEGRESRKSVHGESKIEKKVNVGISTESKDVNHALQSANSENKYFEINSKDNICCKTSEVRTIENNEQLKLKQIQIQKNKQNTLERNINLKYNFSEIQVTSSKLNDAIEGRNAQVKDNASTRNREIKDHFPKTNEQLKDIYLEDNLTKTAIQKDISLDKNEQIKYDSSKRSGKILKHTFSLIKDNLLKTNEEKSIDNSERKIEENLLKTNEHIEDVSLERNKQNKDNIFALKDGMKSIGNNQTKDKTKKYQKHERTNIEDISLEIIKSTDNSAQSNGNVNKCQLERKDKSRGATGESNKIGSHKILEKKMEIEESVCSKNLKSQQDIEMEMERIFMTVNNSVGKSQTKREIEDRNNFNEKSKRQIRDGKLFQEKSLQTKFRELIKEGENISRELIEDIVMQESECINQILENESSFDDEENLSLKLDETIVIEENDDMDDSIEEIQTISPLTLSENALRDHQNLNHRNEHIEEQDHIDGNLKSIKTNEQFGEDVRNIKGTNITASNNVGINLQSVETIIIQDNRDNNDRSDNKAINKVDESTKSSPNNVQNKPEKKSDRNKIDKPPINNSKSAEVIVITDDDDEEDTESAIKLEMEIDPILKIMTNLFNATDNKISVLDHPTFNKIICPLIHIIYTKMCAKVSADSSFKHYRNEEVSDFLTHDIERAFEDLDVILRSVDVMDFKIEDFIAYGKSEIKDTFFVEAMVLLGGMKKPHTSFGKIFYEGLSEKCTRSALVDEKLCWEALKVVTDFDEKMVEGFKLALKEVFVKHEMVFISDDEEEDVRKYVTVIPIVDLLEPELQTSIEIDVSDEKVENRGLDVQNSEEGVEARAMGVENKKVGVGNNDFVENGAPQNKEMRTENREVDSQTCGTGMEDSGEVIEKRGVGIGNSRMGLDKQGVGFENTRVDLQNSRVTIENGELGIDNREVRVENIGVLVQNRGIVSTSGGLSNENLVGNEQPVNLIVKNDPLQISPQNSAKTKQPIISSTIIQVQDIHQQLNFTLQNQMEASSQQSQVNFTIKNQLNELSQQRNDNQVNVRLLKQNPQHKQMNSITLNQVEENSHQKNGNQVSFTSPNQTMRYTHQKQVNSTSSNRVQKFVHHRNDPQANFRPAYQVHEILPQNAYQIQEFHHQRIKFLPNNQVLVHDSNSRHQPQFVDSNSLQGASNQPIIQHAPPQMRNIPPTPPGYLPTFYQPPQQPGMFPVGNKEMPFINPYSSRQEMLSKNLGAQRNMQRKRIMLDRMVGLPNAPDPVQSTTQEVMPKRKYTRRDVAAASNSAEQTAKVAKISNPNQNYTDVNLSRCSKPNGQDSHYPPVEIPNTQNAKIPRNNFPPMEVCNTQTSQTPGMRMPSIQTSQILPMRIPNSQTSQIPMNFSPLGIPSVQTSQSQINFPPMEQLNTQNSRISMTFPPMDIPNTQTSQIPKNVLPVQNPNLQTPQIYPTQVYADVNISRSFDPNVPEIARSHSQIQTVQSSQSLRNNQGCDSGLKNVPRAANWKNRTEIQVNDFQNNQRVESIVNNGSQAKYWNTSTEIEKSIAQNNNRSQSNVQNIAQATHWNSSTEIGKGIAQNNQRSESSGKNIPQAMQWKTSTEIEKSIVQNYQRSESNANNVPKTMNWKTNSEIQVQNKELQIPQATNWKPSTPFKQNDAQNNQRSKSSLQNAFQGTNRGTSTEMSRKPAVLINSMDEHFRKSLFESPRNQPAFGYQDTQMFPVVTPNEQSCMKKAQVRKQKSPQKAIRVETGNLREDFDEMMRKEDFVREDPIVDINQAERTISIDSGCFLSPNVSEEDSRKRLENQQTKKRILVLREYECICGKRADLLCECGMVIYCSSDCQLENWDEHRNTCSALSNP